MAETKVCTLCKVEKPFADFTKSKTGLYGLNPRCRECCALKFKEFAEKNKDKLKQVRKETDAKRADKKKQYREENKEKIAEYHRQYNEENKEHIRERAKEYVEKNREKMRTYFREYARQDHVKETRRKYVERKKAEDPTFKVAHVVRSRILRVLKGARKNDSTFELVGCSPEYLKKYIEWQFDEKMTWDNHGIYWHIDHIVPLSWFDLSDPEQQKYAFDFTNMQPLAAVDNMVKGNRRDG